MPADRKLCVVCSKVFRDGETTCPDDGTLLVVEADEGRGGRLGHVIGNYRLLRVLGEGGVGTVYEAEHVRLGRKVALKLLHPDVVNTELVTRFFNEARAVNEIRHPNIIDVEDFVTTPAGEHYMLMELLSGEDLRSAISREGTLEPARVSAIASQIASALAAVHKVGIIHRDLKPDNVFLTQRDGKEVAKLLDFGIAKFTEDASGVTRAGMTMGTPQYMAPEQIITGKEVGLSSDIYALGMVMYEALTGAPAFNSSNMANILRAHCFEVVVPPSVRREEPIPAVLEAAVMKCLEKEIQHRFASAADLCEALRSSTPVAVTKVTSAPTLVVSRLPAEGVRVRSRTRQLVPAFVIAAAALTLHLWPHATAPAAQAAEVARPPAPAPATATATASPQVPAAHVADTAVATPPSVAATPVVAPVAPVTTAKRATHVHKPTVTKSAETPPGSEDRDGTMDPFKP